MNPAPAPPDRQLEKRQTLWLLLALFFVIGWFSAIITEKSTFYQLSQLAYSLGITIFILRWVALDAAQRRFKLNAIWGIGFVIFSIFVMPLYLYKTRGKACARPIAIGFALLLAYSLSMGIGQTLAGAL